jgi:hypothetical protein
LQKPARELFGIQASDQYARLLVEDPIFQDLYNTHQAKQPDSTKRGESYKSVITSLHNDPTKYKYATEGDVSQFSSVETWAWLLARCYIELREKPNGVLSEKQCDEDSIWAITWVFCKALMTFNNPAKKAKTLSGIRTRALKARNARSQARAKSSVYVVGENLKDHDERTSGPRKTDAAASQSKKSLGVPGKASSKGPKAAASKKAASTKASKQIQSTEEISKNPDDEAAQPASDEDVFEDDFGSEEITEMTEEQLMEDFIKAQDKAEAKQRKKADPHGLVELKLRDCVARLENDPKDYAVYKNCIKALTAVYTEFYDDFVHEDVQDLKEKALQSLIKTVREANGTSRLELNPKITSQSARPVDNDILKETQSAMDIAAIQTNNQFAAKKDTGGEELLQLEVMPPSHDDQEAARSFRTWMISEGFQPTFIKDAMLELGIIMRNQKMVPNQSVKVKLHWWQIIFTKWMTDLRNVVGIKGGVCADAIGLGKTFEIGGSILKVSLDT